MADPSILLSAADISANPVFSGGSVNGESIPALTADDICEEHGSPQEDVVDGGLEATVTVRAPFAYRFAIINELMFRAYPYGGNCYLTAASITPDTGSSIKVGQRCFYEWALLTLNYTQAEIERYNAAGQPFSGAPPGSRLEVNYANILSESITPSAEFVTLPPSNFSWGDEVGGDEIQPEEAPGILLPSLELTQTRYNLATIPSTFYDAVGQTNKERIKLLRINRTFEPGQLMYAGGSTDRTVQVATVLNGSAALGTTSEGWNITTKFLYRKNGWNKFYRAKLAAENVDPYSSIWNKEDGKVQEPYEPVDTDELPLFAQVVT